MAGRQGKILHMNARPNLTVRGSRLSLRQAIICVSRLKHRWNKGPQCMKRTLIESRWSQMPESAIRRWQATQLRDYLNRVVLPFSPHYRQVFREQGLEADSIRTLEDLARVPFTTKADLVGTPEQPQRFKDFIVVPDQRVLARRPGTIVGALLHGREHVRKEFESEFRPVFMTFTTGRAADPVACVYTQRDLAHLATAGRRMMEVCAARPEDRLVNAFPFAPPLAFWLAHYAGTAYGAFMLSSGGGKALGTEGNLRLIRQFKPNVLIGVPTFIYHLLQQAVEEGKSVDRSEEHTS